MKHGLQMLRVILLIVTCLSPLAAGVWMLTCSIEPGRAMREYDQQPSDQTRRAMDEAFAADARRRYGGVSFFGLTFIGSAVGALVITRRLRASCAGDIDRQQRTI